jgi:hypothetical protein
MADSPCRGFKVVTILRGDALRDAQRSTTPTSGTALHGGRTNTSSEPPDQSEPQDGKETIYGVPVSAVQACCGRGCKHCRIYWHRMKS